MAHIGRKHSYYGLVREGMGALSPGQLAKDIVTCCNTSHWYGQWWHLHSVTDLLENKLLMEWLVCDKPHDTMDCSDVSVAIFGVYVHMSTSTPHVNILFNSVHLQPNGDWDSNATNPSS